MAACPTVTIPTGVTLVAVRLSKLRRTRNLTVKSLSGLLHANRAYMEESLYS